MTGDEADHLAGLLERWARANPGDNLSTVALLLAGDLRAVVLSDAEGWG